MTLPHCLLFFLLSNDKAMIKFECEKQLTVHIAHDLNTLFEMHKKKPAKNIFLVYFSISLASTILTY